MPRLTTPLAALVLAGLVAGCASMDDVGDLVSSINPFAEKETPLPGERRAALVNQTPLLMAKNKPVSIPAPRALANWPQAAGPAANNPGHLTLDGDAGTRLWAVQAGDTGGSSFTREEIRLAARPVAVDGRIYVYDPTGSVSAHAAGGGGRIWRQTLRPAGESDPVPGGGVAATSARVYVATGYGTVAALDAASGNILWQKPLGGPARGSPAVGDGKVFVVTQANIVHALQEADGAEAWTYRGVPEIAGLLSAANPAVFGSTVVVPYSSGEIVALDAKTGNALWNDGLARAGRTQAVSGLSDIAASPVIEEGIVYATGVGGRTAAINLKSGQRLWDQAVGSAHTPVVAGNAVFLVDLDDRLVAIDRKTGDVLWANQLPIVRAKRKRTNWAGPVLAGGALWLVSNEGGLIGVDPGSGKVVQTRATGAPTFVAPIVAGGRLLVLAGNGLLAAY